MKKQILFAFICIFTSSVIAKTQNEILMVLVSAHNAAFGKDNLYEKGIPANDLLQWDQAFSAAQKFITDNSCNQLGIQDSDLKAALLKVEKANIALINTIKITRGILTDPKNLKDQVSTFSTIAQEMIQLRNKLGNTTFYLNREQKEQAREILMRIADFIEVTASKAIKDTAR